MTPKNPYRPGVGLPPLYLAGRADSILRFQSALRAAPEQPANLRITGLRGVGKTVLLGEFQTEAQHAGWASSVLELEPRHNSDEGLVQALCTVLQSAREQLSLMERLRSAVGTAARKAGELGVTWGEFSVTYALGSADAREDLTRALFDVVEMAVQKGNLGYVLLLDEAQIIRDDQTAEGNHPLSLLIASVVALQKQGLPIALVLCGLPTLTANLAQARSYTERMFRGEDIGRLSPDEARDALVEPLAEVESGFTIHPDAVWSVVDEVDGYPYFIQLWGAELWDAAENVGTTYLEMGLLEAARTYIYRRLDMDFYEPRLATLTQAETEIVMATVLCPYPPIKVSDLKRVVAKNPSNIHVLLGRLVENGVLYRSRRGEYVFTAPQFEAFLLRKTSAEGFRDGDAEVEPVPTPELIDPLEELHLLRYFWEQNLRVATSAGRTAECEREIALIDRRLSRMIADSEA
jgi:hypothetical protein